jgi:hypothetical protein
MTDNLSGQAITPGQRLFSLHCDHDDPEGSWRHLRPKYRDRWERTASAFNAEAAATLERVQRENEIVNRERNQHAEDLLGVGTELGRARKALEDVRAITSEALADSHDDPEAGRTFFLSIVRLVRNRIENALSVPAEEHRTVLVGRTLDAVLAEESSAKAPPGDLTGIARIICDFMNWPEDGPAWDDAQKLARQVHEPAYRDGWSDREADILERCERVAPAEARSANPEGDA